MTVGEFRRHTESARRREHDRQRQQAAFDYALARLFAIANAATKAKGVTVPDMEEYYSELFNTPEDIARREQEEAEQLAANFINWANAHNQKYKGGA